jgi:AraC-like DNA-binding protein
MGAILPWLANRNLRTQLEAHRQGNALQYLLEKQLMEALSYLHTPSESTRDSFARGAFKTLYACEKFRFGDKAAYHIAHIIESLGLQDYG